MKQIPNILSGLRMLMIGVFVYFFLREAYYVSLGVYILSVATDALDGYLARRHNWISDIGKVLDPLADKLMLIAALICFRARAWIPGWLVAIVVGKELLMIIGGAFLYKRAIVVRADWFGKLATVFFNASVVVVLLKNFWPWLGILPTILLFIAAILALVALVHYAKKNIFNIKDELINMDKKSIKHDDTYSGGE